MAPDKNRSAVEEMMALEGSDMTFSIRRQTIEEGRTFSRIAMDDLHTQMAQWVMTRLSRRWSQTGKPPTAISVEVIVRFDDELPN